MDHIAATRHQVESRGAQSLVVDNLTSQDLAAIAWSGSALYLRSVAQALARVSSGEVEYLCVLAPTGEPVAKGALDFAVNADAGTLWQLATRSELQGIGLGTRLVQVAEDKIRERGLRWAILGVEDNNPRARALYERLGYRALRRKAASWPVMDSDGQEMMYETEVTELRKLVSDGSEVDIDHLDSEA